MFIHVILKEISIRKTAYSSQRDVKYAVLQKMNRPVTFLLYFLQIMLIFLKQLRYTIDNSKTDSENIVQSFL